MRRCPPTRVRASRFGTPGGVQRSTPRACDSIPAGLVGGGRSLVSVGHLAARRAGPSSARPPRAERRSDSTSTSVSAASSGDLPGLTLARAKEYSRVPRAESYDAAHKLGCARSAARLAPKRAPSSTAACRERSHTTLPTNSGARAAQHASRLSARQAVQPHARDYVELSDLGTSRSRSANEARPTRTDRTGACFPSTKRGRPSDHQPSVRNVSLQATRRSPSFAPPITPQARYPNPIKTPERRAPTCRAPWRRRGRRSAR
jgi:hypothetical protein